MSVTVFFPALKVSSVFQYRTTQGLLKLHRQKREHCLFSWHLTTQKTFDTVNRSSRSGLIAESSWLARGLVLSSAVTVRL